MLKQKEIDYKDTNVANIGSQQDLAARVKAAQTEAEWKGAGDKEGIQIWRIEKFNVKSWPVARYGEFYDGDSYILLRTYKNEEGELRWNVHFWLGQNTSIDEQGTAAYKTVELDDLLGTLPVQYREVQGLESGLFLSYFKHPISVVSGGVESGFNKVKPEEYKPRLFQLKGKTKVACYQVPLSGDSLNQGDVFVLDGGLKIFVWSGSKSRPNEKYSGNVYAESLQSQRGDKVQITHVGEDGSAEFWAALGGQPAKLKTAEEGGDDAQSAKPATKKLFQLSDATGKLEFKQVGEGSLTKGLLNSNDVFILDAGNVVYTWIGGKTSTNERKFAMFYALQYLKNNGRDASKTTISRVSEGVESAEFLQQFK